jgi:hypothetical protein
MPGMEREWTEIVQKYSLQPPTLEQLVAGSWQFFDREMRPGGNPAPPSLVSTI